MCKQVIGSFGVIYNSLLHAFVWLNFKMVSLLSFWFVKCSCHNLFTDNSVLYCISHTQAKWILNELIFQTVRCFAGSCEFFYICSTGGLWDKWFLNRILLNWWLWNLTYNSNAMSVDLRITHLECIWVAVWCT